MTPEIKHALETIRDECRKHECCNRSNPKWTPQRVKTLIVRQPPADAVPIIRCKDCAKDGLFTCPMCWIENHTLEFINHDPNFYCGAAERK